jgi:hypothetical protein
MRLITGMIVTALMVLLSILPSADVRGEESEGSFTSALMRSTFKLERGRKVGTAFVMAEPSPYNTDYSYFVLLTAAHLLEGPGDSLITIHFRTSQNDLYKRVPCKYAISEGGRQLWVKHPEVDIGAMRISKPATADFDLLSTDFFTNDSLLTVFEIHPGDEVFCLGYPRGLESNDAGFPVLRSGHIASYPLSPTATYKTFYMDFLVFPGNSGGPVFLESTISPFSGRGSGGILRLMMGLVSQKVSVKEQIRSIGEVTVRDHDLSLAIVVQAVFLEETVTMLPAVSEVVRPDCH